MTKHIVKVDQIRYGSIVFEPIIRSIDISFEVDKKELAEVEGDPFYCSCGEEFETEDEATSHLWAAIDGDLEEEVDEPE